MEELAAELYRMMLRIRRFEETVVRCYAAGEVPGFCHVSIGQESVAAGVCSVLLPDDVITSTHRGHGHVLAKGCRLDSMFAELFGKPSGACSGLGGSMHIADLDRGIFGANGIVGAGLPIAVGAGLAAQLEGGDRVAVAFFGDGALSQGAFHEATNLAALWRLPVVLVCENNHYAEFSRLEDTHPVAPAVRASAYGIAVERADGGDVLDVRAAAERAVAAARSGSGPTFLEVEVDRWHGHYEGDGVAYRDPAEVAAMRDHDPIVTLGRQLDVEVRTQIDTAVAAEIEDALATARASPDQEAIDLAPFVVAGGRVDAVPNDAYASGEIRYVEAVAGALADAMTADERVFVAGIDVGGSGGAFRASRGLLEQFGPARVRDTPISETAIIGMAVGSALSGFRPVVEIMYVDFLGVCLDQLVNQAAKMRFMTGGRAEVSLVVRTQYGAGRSSGAQHSQSLETVLAAFPGLAVVMPSTAADAYGLLRAAIEDPNPVVVIEHRHLYGRRGPAPADAYRVPLGKAAIVRPGNRATVVSTGRFLWETVAVADALAADGIELEVIDVRSIVPLDLDTIVGSVRRTGRLAVVHEAPAPFGFGAEIVAGVEAAAFFDLDAPARRITPPRTPAPYAKRLEEAWLPDRARIARELREFVAV